MHGLSDEEITGELLKRLRDKDRAYHDLSVVTKKLEAVNARLIESEKLKTDFLSNIRNEINNPLTSVLTLCEFLVSDADSTGQETLISVAGTIYREAFNLSFQLRNIFAAAELEAGDAVLCASNVDIPALIRNTTLSFKQRMTEKKLSVAINVGEEWSASPYFVVDADKLQRVLANLLTNAIEFSHEGKNIEIRAGREGSSLVVIVEDHGIGIEKDAQGIIFDRFRQLETGVTKSHAGHGLGLSIVKAFVELMNGTITVRSAKNEGTAFTVTLPEGQAVAGASAFSEDGNDFFFNDSGEKF
ncbi:MAG: HAMP domain-containing histidine kinase [Deltaproteobacteria bacterium]|nr:HAMP domain-containing histidine kinase [Deltaproteobacteria bacterium]